MRSPKSVTITENVPGSVEHFLVVAKRDSDGVQLASKQYAPTGGTTVAAIGADEFFASVADGESIRLYVTELNSSGNGPVQEVPGGPFPVKSLADGAENLSVQL